MTVEPISEQWRPVPGYEGRYEVSDQGRVRSVGFYSGNRWGTRTWRAGRVLRPAPHERGHLYAHLSDGQGGLQSRPVHRMVLRAFAGGPPEGKPNALHRDDDPANNCVENLYWGSDSENSHDAVRNGGHTQARKQVCPIDHELSAPNLAPSSTAQGGRACLACTRTRGSHNADRRRMPKRYNRGRDGFLRRAGESFRDEADRRYRMIMGSRLVDAREVDVEPRRLQA